MAKPRGLVPYFRARGERELEEHVHKITRALNEFPFLGFLSVDPDTTGWGAQDLCIWVNNATPTAVVIKFWNGAAIRTITSS